MLLFVFWAGASALANAAEPAVTEYQIKAAFLYKFCLYVEWPAIAFAGAESPIVLGVAGSDTLIELLQNAVKDRAVHGRPLQVRRVDANTALGDLQLLFVANSEQGHLPKLAAQTRDMPLLLVTENPGGLDDASVINFAVQDNRIRFDVDLNSGSRRGLRLSAQLLKVARAVRGETEP